eukprot:183011_1
MAVGYDSTKDLVLIYGGAYARQQFVTFGVINNQFTDINEEYLSFAQNTVGVGQHYSQLGNDLWVIHHSVGSSLLKINTETYAVTDPGIKIPVDPERYGCLVAIPNFLIIIGGGTYVLDEAQIYNLATSQWLTGVPSLATARRMAACVAVNDKVYIIGGYHYRGSTYNYYDIDTIESLDISTLPTTAGLSWTTLSSKLASRRVAPRAVVHGTDIYVVGGAESGPKADVNVIDTINGSCEVRDTLAIAVYDAVCIIVDDVLYAFGGRTGQSDAINNYQYTTLPTNNPTASSSNPTLSPTKGTKHPSIPTKYPTGSPITLDPTTTPTKYPTVSPMISDQATSSTNTIYGDNDTAPNVNPITTQWIIDLLTPEIMVSLIILVISCFCCCGAYLCFKYFKTKKDKESEHIPAMTNVEMQNAHEMNYIAARNDDLEREMVASWLRYTVQLPQYIHLFISHGYDSMEAIQGIAGKNDLLALGIKRDIHHTLMLTEIKGLQDTDFVVKGITHGSNVITVDEHEQRNETRSPDSDSDSDSKIKYTTSTKEKHPS